LLLFLPYCIHNRIVSHNAHYLPVFIHLIMRLFIPFFILTVSCIFSCSTRIELDVPESVPQPVVYSLITEDSSITVNVSKTVSIQESATLFVNDANVELWSGNHVIEKLMFAGDGTYKSSNAAQKDLTYTLFVDVPGFERIQASTKIPADVNIINGTINTDSYYDQQQMQYVSEVTISIDDPPNADNYYQVSFYNYVSGYNYVYNSNYEVIDSIFYERYGELHYLNSKDPVIINEGDLQYYGDPGAIRSLVFSDELLAEDNTVTFLTQLGREFSSKQIAVLRNISYDYYNYKKSWIRQNFNQGLGSFDPSNNFLTSNPNDLYTNMENGLGIFAAYSETHYELEEIE